MKLVYLLPDNFCWHILSIIGSSVHTITALLIDLQTAIIVIEKYSLVLVYTEANFFFLLIVDTKSEATQ